MLNFRRYQPFLNRVLVKRVEPITKTKGGILLQESKGMELNYGTVVAAGPGLTLSNGQTRPNAVQTGQTVLLPLYAGAKVQMGDGQEYWLYRDDDILGVLDEPTK